MTESSTRTVNKEFHSTFATIAVTILSIMLAFYGITVITLANQAQQTVTSEQSCNANSLTSENDTVNCLRQTDGAIGNFVYTTKPELTSANWSITMEQENNLQMVFDKFYVPSYNVVNSDINSILGNFTEGLQMDESMTDWLAQNNVTHFEANYVLAIINLDELIHVFYEQFPAPQATINQSQIVVFIDDNFSKIQPFLNWFQEYQSFYQNVSDAHSKLNDAIKGISQAYMDSYTMDSQAITQLQQNNVTWAIQGLSEIMAYDKAMSTYYPSIFGFFDTIFSSANNASLSFDLYKSYVNQSQSYQEQYNALHDVAFSNVFSTVLNMAISGVFLPMSLLGLANSYQSKLEKSKRARYLYFAIIAVYILWFAIATIIGMNTLWAQITKIFP